MNRKLSIIILIPLIILGVIFPVQTIPRTHAVTMGLVCIASTNDISGGHCPVIPSPLTGPLTTNNTLIRVPIIVNNTDSFLTFDITVNSSDTSMLRPYGADMTGSIMPSGTIILVECVGGVKVLGSTCNPGTDNPSSIRIAASLPLGAFGFPPGTSGLLFTAIFRITGTTLPGGARIGFQSGCPAPTSNGNLCLTFGNGTNQPVPENVRTATFDNSNANMLEYLTMDVSTTTSLGQYFQGTANPIPAMTVMATSLNGFSDTSIFAHDTTVQLGTTVSGSGSNRPTVTLSTTSLDMSAGRQQTFTLSGNVPANAPVGVYNVTITGLYSAFDNSTFTEYQGLLATVFLRVSVVDYSISASPSSVSLPAQTSASVQTSISVIPSNGNNFIGTVALTATVPAAAAGVTFSYAPPSVTGQGSSTLTLSSTTSTPQGTYTITLNASSTLNGVVKKHTASITLLVTPPDFSLSANPQTVSVVAASIGGSSTITVTKIQGFAGTVALTSSISPSTGLNCNISPSSVTITSSSNSASASLLCQGTAQGTYTVTVTGTSTTPALTHRISVTYTVEDFTVSAAPSTVIVNTGAVGSSTVTVVTVNGFTGTVDLTLSRSPTTGITCSLSPTSITLGSSGTSTLTCTATTRGSYTITVTGTSGSLSHATTVTYIITTPDFGLTATTPGTVTLGTTAQTTIVVAPLNGFTGNVTLTATVPTGLTCSPVVPKFIINTGTATLSCSSGTAASYTVTVTGTNETGSLSHSTTITFLVVEPHDVVIVSTSSTTGQATAGTKVPVNVIVQNKGALDETVTVYLVADNVTVATMSGISVPANSQKNVTIYWDTSQYSAKMYKLSAMVSLPAGESNVEAGTVDLGQFTVRPSASPYQPDTTTIAGLAALVILGGAVAIIVRRRRKANDYDANPAKQKEK